MAAPVRSSPLAALGALIAVLAIATLGRRMPPPPEARTATTRAPQGPVDLNLASAEELERLPRVGPALAARIVAHRERFGPFATLAELDAVPGIGPGVLAAIRAHVTVTMPARDAHALPSEDAPR